MKSLGSRIVLAVFAPILALAGAARAADEAQLIAVLESAPGESERCEACRQLLVAGSVRCVPVLAKALGDGRVGHAAIHTLERLPFPEAAEAMLEAIGTVDGPVKVGLIDSIGWRGDPGVLRVLAPLLHHDDASVASATATALGRIGGPEASAELTKSIAGAGPEVRRSILEALLLCAEDRLRRGGNAGAAAIYGMLHDGEFPETIRAAALRGLLVSDEARRRQLFVESVTGPNRRFRNVALGFVRQLDDGSALCSLLPRWASLPPEVKMTLLEAHRQLGDEGPKLAITAATDENGAVRMTALRVMGDMQQASVIPRLTRLASGGDKPEQLTARNSLERIGGPGLSAAMRQYLAEAPDDERVELLRILGRRGDTERAGAGSGVDDQVVPWD